VRERIRGEALGQLILSGAGNMKVEDSLVALPVRQWLSWALERETGLQNAGFQ